MQRKHNKRKILTLTQLFVVSLIFLFIGSNFNIVASSQVDENDTALNYTIRFEKPIITETTLNGKTYTQVHMQNCISNAATGNPALPVYPVKILLPQGKTVSTIDVSYDEIKDVSCDLSSSPIMPQQEPISIAIKKERAPFQMNAAVYNSKNPVLDSIYNNGGIDFCRGFAILTINIYPVQYMPGLHRLHYFPELKINIELADDNQNILDESLEMLRLDSTDLDIIKSIVVNPEIANDYAPLSYQVLSGSGLCNSEDTYDYVIITNEALNNTIGEEYSWSDLLKHRVSYSGLSAAKVTVENIGSCQYYWNDTALFNDSAAHIREFIKDAYINWDTKYVILGGDWDDGDVNKQIVPERTFYVSGASELPYPTMPCDMYYSHLDGNWRDAAHGCWGGGKNSGVNDHYAEVYIGRMTVSSAKQISNFIKKIIWYDLYSDNEFIRKAAFFGGNLGWDSVTSADYMEEIRSGNDPNFYQCKGFLEWNEENSSFKYNISTRLYHNWGESIPSAYQTAINNNDACLINHLSHGSTTIGLDMTTAQLGSLSNTKYFFSYSAQCLSGRFTDGTTPEKTLTSINANSGAFGLIWNTGYGWGSDSNTNGPNQYLQRQFWHYLFSSSPDDWTIGKAQAYAKDELSNYVDTSWHYAWCYNWYSSHLFGDPAQKIKFGDSDESIVLTSEIPVNETSMPAGMTTLRINVSDPEGNLINVIFKTNATGNWLNIGTNNSQPNGTYSQTYDFNYYNTTCWWSVNVYDTTGSSGWTNETYNFITGPYINQNPDLQNETPNNQSTRISITTINLSVHIYDVEGDLFNWTIETSPNIGNNYGNNESNGSKTCNISNLNCNTTYYWYVNTTDRVSGNWTNKTYFFTTELNIPTFSNITPSNQSTDVSVTSSVLSINIENPENTYFNWSIETNPNIGNIYGNNSLNGQKTCNISSLNYYTTYYWFVNVSNTSLGIWTNKTYWFKTRQQPSTPSPSSNPPPAPPSQNNPPVTPSTPEGATTGYIDTTYDFTTTSTDPDNDNIKYKFNWGDGSISNWTNLTDSGTQISLSHSWSSSGIYKINAIAQDENDQNSSWSEILNITIEEKPEEKPEIKVDNVPDSVSTDENIVFNVSETNGLDENFTYFWDFGDGTIGIGKQPSHKYTSPGNYIIILTVTNANDVVEIITFEVAVSAENLVTTLDTIDKKKNEGSQLLPIEIILLGGGWIFCLIIVIYLLKKS